MPLLDLLCKCGFNTLLMLLTSFVSAILQNQISLSGVLPKFEPLCPLYWVSAAFRDDKTFHRGTFKTSHFSAKFVESERNFFFWSALDCHWSKSSAPSRWTTLYGLLSRNLFRERSPDSSRCRKHWNTKTLRHLSTEEKNTKTQYSKAPTNAMAYKTCTQCNDLSKIFAAFLI